MLEITYQEKRTSLIDSTTTVRAIYFMDYYQGVTAYETWLRWGLGIACALVLVVTVWRVVTYRRRNPSHLVPPGQYWRVCCLKPLYELANLWSAIMIVVLFAASAWWFTSYKMADRVHLLLPSSTPGGRDEMYFGFYCVFGSTLAAKTLAVVLKILEQSAADVFIMDWESLATGGGAARDLGEQPQKEGDDLEVHGEDAGPQAWRSIFIANELNELQTEMRKIPPATTLIWFTAFYIGLGWQWIAKTNPGFGEEENPLEPFNEFLKFFLACFVFICIATVQYILYTIGSAIYSPPSLEFADLCLFANCSVLMLTEPFAGYYIHGKAPWEQSDLPLGWLKEELDKEAAGKLKARGFNVADADQNKALAAPTTFEIYAHPTLRAGYDRMLTDRLEEAEAAQKQKAEAAPKAKTKPKKGDPGVPSAAETLAERYISRVEQRKRRLNGMLCTTFNAVDARKPDNVLERGWRERLAQRAPRGFDVNGDEPAVPFALVRDTAENAPAFEETLYCSLDVDLVQLMALWWFLFDSLTGNPMLAVALTYLVEAALKWLRATLGERNLVRKTLTAENFLN